MSFYEFERKYEYLACKWDPLTLEDPSTGYPALHDLTQVWHATPEEHRHWRWLGKFIRSQWDRFEKMGACRTGWKVFRLHRAGCTYWARPVAVQRDVQFLAPDVMVSMAIHGKLPSTIKPMDRNVRARLIAGWPAEFTKMVIDGNKRTWETMRALNGLLNNIPQDTSAFIEEVPEKFPKAAGVLLLGGFHIPMTLHEWRQGFLEETAHRGIAADAVNAATNQLLDEKALWDRIESFVLATKGVTSWVVMPGFEDNPEVLALIGDETYEVLQQEELVRS